MSRRDRKLEERRQEILSAAMHLFETKGFAQTSMEEIAEAADIARGTLYNHFESKADVLVALRSSAKEVYQEEALERAKAGESPVALIEDFLMKASTWFDDHPHLIAGFQESLSLMMAKQGLGPGRRILVPPELVKMAQERGQLNKQMSADLMAFLLDMTVRYCVMAKLNEESDSKIAPMVKIAVKELLARFAQDL